MQRSSTWRDRLRYAFDTTLDNGPIALIGWLLLVVIIAVIMIFLVVKGMGAVVYPKDANDSAVFWTIFLQALTPNPFDVTAPLPFLLAMLVTTFVGLLVFSVLIGILNAGIEARIEALRRGKSRVLESGHTIILNWNAQIFTILNELEIANESAPRQVVVVMADKDKVEMEEEIRNRVHLPTRRKARTRIVVRSGSPIDLADLGVVSLNTSKSIIVLGPEEEDPDSSVIKTILAITNNPNRRKEPYHVVAVLRDPKNLEVARLVGGKELELALAGDIISRITAQTCRQSGLSVVYTDLLNFEGDEIYFHEAQPWLHGKTYGEALFGFETTTLMGLRVKGGSARINPPMDTRIHPGDHLILIASDDTVLGRGETLKPPVDEGHIRATLPPAPAPERTLILGWNWRAPQVIRHLDSYVAPGSVVHIVSDCEVDETQLDWAELQNLTVTQDWADTTERAHLERLNPASYQHVIVLSYSDILDIQRADARTLVSLLHLRQIAARMDKPFSIVSEMLDVRNRDLADIAPADDFIVSDTLISLLLTMIAENKELNAVFEDIFDPDGSEIYLKLAGDYVQLGSPVNFYTVLEAARRRGETAIGYRIKVDSTNPDKNHGIHLNPKKSDSIVFAERDRIIVLAED
jgi:voltage-gated potassium channel Kch